MCVHSHQCTEENQLKTTQLCVDEPQYHSVYVCLTFNACVNVCVETTPRHVQLADVSVKSNAWKHTHLAICR